MNSKPSFIDRTLSHLRKAWQDMGQSSVCPIDLQLSPDLPEEEHFCLLEQMSACLEAKGGDVAARVGAARLGNAYVGLNDTGKIQFLSLLASHFDISKPVLEQTIADYQQATDPHQRRRLQRQLKLLLDAPRKQLLTQFNALPQGIKFLVDMRADLRRLSNPEDQPLHDLEEDLQDLLVSWFDVGFLKLQQITWDSSASLLEKLIEYEAVHEIRDWEDLKHRLAMDRRLFAFFHPSMPDEPLIFIQVALVRDLASNIHQVLDDRELSLIPEQADTAIFYSISNAQRGLAGISFGNFLIKRVVSVLKKEFPNLESYATLSPIPGFRRWLNSTVKANSRGLVSTDEWQMLMELVPEGTEKPLHYLLEQPHWHQNEELCLQLEPLLTRLCGHYLLIEKRRGHQALDPVAHFHLSNGARIEQLNWLADRSDKGLQRSAGIMVNYLYDLDNIEANSENYSADGSINAHDQINTLIKD
ncbi:MAG: malonyl-CoA decarboxylase [Motiliproteus sp.]|nr:malonyl-CoA decarboxylase [Motiliproteus sp.]MCW9051420.1 malonyl-CoA decarboxylase [Motiliproteus sp.]